MYRHFLIVALAVVLVPACQKVDPRINSENFEKIQTGMTFADVEALLGPGARPDDGDASLAEGSSVAGAVGVGGDLGSMMQRRDPTRWYRWGSDRKHIRVAFVDDKVAASNFKQSKGLD